MSEQTPSKLALLSALREFARKRPGMEVGNYGDYAGYRSELRSVTKDLQIAQTLLRAVELRSTIDSAAILKAAQSAFSGRLSFKIKGESVAVDYCVGQYFPTEYRKAVCAVLASALWDYVREHCMPAPYAHRVCAWQGKDESEPLPLHAACELLVAKGGGAYGHVSDLYKTVNKSGMSLGDYMRDYFKREFGRGIANSYFN